MRKVLAIGYPAGFQGVWRLDRLVQCDRQM